MIRYIVWVKEASDWHPNGDGLLTKKQAERIAREIRQGCNVPTKFLPVGVEPDGRFINGEDRGNY